MPRTKPTTRPKPSKPAPPALQCDLPGGGRAYFRADHELTPRHTRPLENLQMVLAPLIGSVAAAQRLATSDDTIVDVQAVLSGPAFNMDEDDADRMSRLNDVAILAYWKRWVSPDGDDLPLPATADDLLDIPEPVYDALRQRAGELWAARQADKFTVAALPENLDDADEDLPTSA